MYAYLREYQPGQEISTQWKTRGRKPIMTGEDVIEVSKIHLEREGRAISDDDIKLVLNEKREIVWYVCQDVRIPT